VTDAEAERASQEVDHLPVPSGLVPPDNVVGSLES